MSRSTEEKGNTRCDSDFCRIEELIRGNCFSREEVDRLVEILNSSAENEREKHNSSINIQGDVQLVSRTQEIQGTTSREKNQDIDRTMIGTFHQNSDVPVRVAASPVDIARAYMAGRASEGGLDHDNLISKFERAQPRSEFKQKQFLPSPSPKPSICWPGAVVHDRHGFATPHSQRGRNRLHDFPRTPYSRTTLWKSAAKLQADNEYPHTSTPFLQSQTSLYGQVKSRDKLVDSYGSVGPIRRIRNKLTSEVRPGGSVFLGSPKDIPLRNVSPKDLGCFLPSIEKNMELGETSDAPKHLSGDNVSNSSNRGISNQSLSSSQAVRKILEHLDRNKPTPKEKKAELMLVTSQRSSEGIGTFHEEIVNSIHDGELASHKTYVAGQSVTEEINKNCTKSSILLSFQEKHTGEAQDAVNSNAKTSSSVSPGSNILPHGNAMLHFGLKRTSCPGVKDSNKNTFANTTNNGQNQAYLLFSSCQPSDGQDMKMVGSLSGTELPKDNSARPTLPSISIRKPDFRPVLSDNGPGFTFPVSASSGVLSELPTPSITPPSLASFLSLPAAVPSYSFGTTKSTPSLVFSFPSTSSAPAKDDSNLKFSFGTDNKATKLSFSTFGKDAICY